jgi:hypothetical protein
MSGGVFRAIRHAIGMPMRYRMDEQDYQVISPRMATGLAHVGLFAMVLSYMPWLRGWR